MKEVLESYKKDYWDGENFTASFQEEFLTDEGFLDLPYIKRKHKLKATTNASMKKAVAEVFGRTKFSKIPQPSDLTTPQFIANYKFGEFEDTRGWITHFSDVLDVHVTRKDLYDFIIKHKQAPNNTTERKLPHLPVINGWRYYLAPEWLLF